MDKSHLCSIYTIAHAKQAKDVNIGEKMDMLEQDIFSQSQIAKGGLAEGEQGGGGRLGEV